jgi:CheY-like chemotaxis protein/anti-sigma regulatory factor (Ser/Thr protein kinase)
MTKILIIEDEHALRKDIMEMLSFEGYTLLGAENGLVGIQEARKHLPDLIICDIMMPELDGYDVLDELRRDPQTAAIPFIFLTARTDRMDRRHGMEQGADDYLTKPFSVSDLLKTISARLQRRADIERVTEQRMEELRGNIILSMPHELRTPLTVILGFSDLLLSEENPNLEQIREMAQHINKAATRLYHLIENYLIYAQIETSASDADFVNMLRESSTSHPRVVIEDQAIQKSQLYNRESDLKLEVADVSGVRILEEYLKKMVEEIVDNAFKFSEPGTPVYVAGSSHDGHYSLRISNHGRGMTAQQIRGIGAYMQFGRILHEQQGAGLGLVIARRLAELHGTELRIESIPDQQTAVILNMPLTS